MKRRTFLARSSAVTMAVSTGHTGHAFAATTGSRAGADPCHRGPREHASGLPGAAMDDRQPAMLFDLISEWAGILNDAHAAPRLQEIRDGLADTRFAWNGPTAHEPGRNGASYFRVHGPKLFVESSPQEPGGDLTLHTHTIYRDPSNPTGRAFA